MIGATLGAIREYVESLSVPDGRYYLVCGRTGDRPAPATDLAFETRTSARAAAVATEQYRDALARYDPTAPRYDVIVCERLLEGDLAGTDRCLADATAVEDQTDSRRAEPPSRNRIDVCHTVAGAVFEAIAASAHAGLEEAVMDTYLDLAESITRPDDLCLRLLRSIAVELDAHLEPGEQATLLSRAARNVPTTYHGGGAADPLERALSALQATDLLESYALERSRRTRGCAGRSWWVELEGYALAEGPDHVVTLPIVVELFGQLATRSLSVTGAERLAGTPSTWRLCVRTDETVSPTGLVRVSSRGR